MPKLEYLQQKSEKLRIVFKFLLNAILSLFVGISGLVFALATKVLSSAMFIVLVSMLLIIFLKLVIITIVVWRMMADNEEKILKEPR